MLKHSAPRRRDSLKNQWDKTTKVINIKEKIYSNVADKYTDLQKATFTKWVNIQLRTIEEVINESTDLSSTVTPHNKTKKKIPEIKSIDKDFQDGKKLIELLELLYENDKELPKPERGKTRHHHIQNVNKVLEFLQKKLDDNGLNALKAIGPVDIVDGNVKLTLGLIWLMISKFHQMINNVFEITEEELSQVEERFKEDAIKESELATHSERGGEGKEMYKNSNNTKSSNDAFENFQSRFRKHFVESSGSDNGSILGSPIIFEEEPEELVYEDPSIQNQSIENKLTENELIEDRSIDSQFTENTSIAIKPTLRSNSVRNRILSNSNRLSLPPNYDRNFGSLRNCKDEGKGNFNPTRFRTLRLKSSSSQSPASSSSGLLFWINMQLIDYASMLPLTCYPVEDFIGMNDGIILTALIHHINIEWINDFDLLIKDEEESESNKEIKIKERLTKCFDILNDKLNIPQPKALISMLIEKDHSDKERLKRTGLAWSIYIGEIFLSVIHASNKKKEMRKQSKLILLDENQETISFKETEETSPDRIEENNNSIKSRGYLPFFKNNNITPPSKRNSMATSNLPPLPPWTPKVSLVSAVWDWTLSWMINDNDNDNYDSDDYDKNGELKEREMRTISKGSLTRKSKQNNWDIKNINEWQSKNESSLNDDDAPLQLLENTHQPALYKYWN